MYIGPTHFAPVIQQAIKIASIPNSQTHKSQKYFVLLILTDGMINDIDATIAAIIKASHYPLSILIVGVGNADFSTMQRLDSDGKVY